jgi:enoyl-CoA hydratase/carnithine racemase
VVSGPSPVDVSVEDRVAWVRLDVPERRNAISQAMRSALAEAMTTLDEDDNVRVAVVTGNGSAFCAGVDLKEGAAAGGSAAADDPVAAPFLRFGKPLIAAINGAAIGGGLELALAADLRVASPEATFALPEVRIGSLPGSGGTQRLSRLVPAAIANKLVFTGEPLDAETALRCGLISDLVATEELIPFAGRLAATIAANAPLSLRAAKVALRAAQEDPLRPGLVVERTLWELLSTTEDREEGRVAFRERRPPRFIGR